MLRTWWEYKNRSLFEMAHWSWGRVEGLIYAFLFLVIEEIAPDSRNFLLQMMPTSTSNPRP